MSHLISVYIKKEYLITKEQEQTKREAIRAWNEVELARIREDSAIIRGYLECSFAERAHNFDQFFRLLDVAIETNNHEGMQIALAGIIELARQSPLRDAIEAARAITEAVYDPKVKEIDI